jgi:hypothetical protein
MGKRRVSADLSVIQSKVESGLENLFAQLKSLDDKYWKEAKGRSNQRFDLHMTYMDAKEEAYFERDSAYMHGSTTINLDTATHVELSHIRMMIHREKQATDASQEAIEITRLDLRVLEEIREMCCQVLVLADETDEGRVKKNVACSAAAAARAEQLLLVRQLKFFFG